MTLRVSVAGLGRAGRAVLSECLGADGVEVVGAWNRSPVGPLPLAEILGARLAVGGAVPPSAHQDCDLLLLAVSDRAVPAVAGLLSPPSDAAVVHLSGAADVSLLDPLPSGSPGCWHPLQAFASGRPPEGAPPYAVALQGSPLALRHGRALAELLGHPSAELAADGRAAYHASAVLASNCLVALQSSAVRVMQRAGVDAEQSWELLWPLVAGTLTNLSSGPVPGTLTGPVARGDVPTVKRNLAAIEGDDKATASYIALGAEAVRLARLQGLDEGAADVLDELFACPRAEGD
ncbi:MAG: DUF2520 domain-containing protein [Deltaproteobacteria bacterium]|nr:DUF2520 domain-containing protein [Deltaproteobacteria bacterium]